MKYISIFRQLKFKFLNNDIDPGSGTRVLLKVKFHVVMHITKGTLYL